MVTATATRTRSVFDALGTLAGELAATKEMSDVARAAQRWATSTFGEAATTLSRPDRMGRLHLVHAPHGASAPGRKRSARRRDAFERGEPATIEVATGRRLAIVPAKVGDRTVAVLELEAAAEAVSRRWTALEAAAAQIGLAIDRISQERRLRRDLEAMRRAAALGRDLERVRSPRAAVRVVCRLVADAFDVPVAAWYADAPGPATVVEAPGLVEVAGLGSRRRKEARRTLSAFSVPLTRGDRARAVRAFSEVVGSTRVDEHEIGSAVFLVADADAAVGAAFEVARPLLANVIRGLHALDEVDLRRAELHARGAWAAHELRAPILGLRAALDVVLGGALGRGDGATILRRSIAELEHLAAVSETLLTSTVDGQVPEVGPMDVVPLIREAIHAIGLGTDETRVVLIGAAEAVAPVDRIYLRTAIDNLLRNALAYSGAGTKVTVEVDAHADGVEIRVENEATAIGNDEVELLFTPFVRRTTVSAADRAASARRGSGLGLFIASQAVRAQGGRLWAEAKGNVIVFHLAIAAAAKEELRSAS